MISVRLSDEEKTKLERIQALLAKHWKRQAVEQAVAVRAALEMCLEWLEHPGDAGKSGRATRGK
jgi:hypothetical protein